MITVDHLTKRYRGATAVDDVSFTARPGRVTGDDLVVIGNGRIVAQGSKQDLLSTAGTVVSSADNTRLAGALADAGLDAAPSGGGSLHTPADPDHVGRIALAAGVALTELRSADSAGLEEMFLALTAESQRDSTVPEGGTAA